ncbi:MAG: dephospho-CoA kinase [Gammaproteobacteria bacterium]|nr:dephospho-CoA kinase [Gammaproteobacteria bacterium]
MIKIALTGGIGCGKSTVCNLFNKQHHIPVIDTDIIARRIVEPGSPALIEISKYFGDSIVLKDGSLNRKALAEKVFNNEDDRLHLESILHPEIKKVIQKKIKKLKSSYVIIAIPLLIETNQQSEYDRILVIDCKEEQQIERTLKRDQRDLDEIKSILKSQVSRETRLKLADDIIDNSQSTSSLKEQVKRLHTKYSQLANNKPDTD